MRRFLPILFLIITLGLVPAMVYAQQHGGHSSDSSSGSVTTPKTDSGKSADADKKMSKRDRMAEREKMHQEMQAMQQRLDDKVAAMNSATGDQKVAAMSDVINELVSQRKQMMGKFKGHHKGGKMGMHGKGCCDMMHKGKGGMHKDGGMMGSHDMRFRKTSAQEPVSSGVQQ